jgi:hypothetical protein
VKRISNTHLIVKVKAVILTLFLSATIFLSAILTIAHFPQTMDFGSFLASGKESLSKGNPYSYDNKLVFIVPINEFNLLIPSPNLNPPITILFFAPLASINIEPTAASMLWKTISVFWYIALTYYLIKTNSAKWTTALWVFALAGFWQTIEVGQIYMPLVTLALLAWDQLKKNRPVTAGILIGLLIAVKPQFAIWVIFLFFTSQWKSFISSMLTFILISLIPLQIYGMLIYIQWAQAIFQYNGILLPGNTSLQSFAAHMGLSQLVGNLIGATLLFCALAFTVIKKIKPIRSNFIALLSTLLASPYSWCGYTLFLLPIFFDQTKWSWKKKMAAGLLTVPFMITLAAFATTRINFIVFGWSYGWAVVLLLLDELTLPTLSCIEEQKAEVI